MNGDAQVHIAFPPDRVHHWQEGNDTRGIFPREPKMVERNRSSASAGGQPCLAVREAIKKNTRVMSTPGNICRPRLDTRACCFIFDGVLIWAIAGPVIVRLRGAVSSRVRAVAGSGFALFHQEREQLFETGETDAVARVRVLKRGSPAPRFGLLRAPKAQQVRTVERRTIIQFFLH